MALEHRLACMLPNSLHARPATHLQAVASRFAAEVTLVNERTGVEANAKSVLALISADIQSGDPMLLRVSGPGQEAAFEDLTRFLRDDFAGCDEAPAAAAQNGTGVELPRSLRAAAPERVLHGTPLCRGLAEGVVRRAEGLRLAEALLMRLEGALPADEFAKFEGAVVVAGRALDMEIAAAEGTERDVLAAHAALLNDVSFAEGVAAELAGNTRHAAHGILDAIQRFSVKLQKSTSAYLRERALDLQDIGARLLREIYGADAVVTGPLLEGPAIVVAESMTPGQFLALDREHLRGLVLQHAGATSHTVILARGFGLPILVGVEGAGVLADGTEAVLDTNHGILLPEPNAATRRYYGMEHRRIEHMADRESAFIASPGMSRDGHRIPVLANVSSAEEAPRAISQGAEGVGLFRTEMLFMERDSAPSEDEQAEVYSDAVRAAGGRPVTLRTFDIGGDKPAPYLELPSEPNPFLGYRGVRIYEQFCDLLRAQIRAMFRAAEHGPVRIMAPMISAAEEMRSFRALVEEIRANFSPREVLVGMMIEIPSVAFAVEECARHADFFSLGTNDLLQYFFAADRDNARVALISSAFEPSFTRLLRRIVDEAHSHGRQIGLCGELAEKSEALPMLLGLNLDSISLGAARIAATKAEVASLDFEDCRRALEEAARQPGRMEVESYWQGFRRGTLAKPILDLALIKADSDSVTKHEVIKELSDLLSLGRRVSDSSAIEEAIWLREETYSTGFGFGFALPHCQSSHVVSNSIALVRPRQPVEWGALDGQPVKIAILIALRAEDKGREHLRIFARLSRLVMNEDFRARLEQAADSEGLYTILQSELGL